ncbi:MAG TPA: 6-phosphogluconolactonase [Marmoricola sp.]|jgi:6-phosphogluconolactonase|nr:6-phosphogluconolactonase [Marmoricola sp.]
MELHVAEDAPALATEVAEAFLQRMKAAQDAGETPQVALTGGTIAVDIHREIARLAKDAGVDFSRIVFWFGDERFVAPDSPDRNAKQARDALLDAVGATQVHEMASTADASSPDEGADQYAALVREKGSGEFDLVFLGLGGNAHVASLMPGAPQLDVTDRIAVGVTDSPKPPPERISLTFPALNRTRSVWFVVSGANKADAVAAALADEGDVHETPARGITVEDQVWYLDDAAAAKL